MCAGCGVRGSCVCVCGSVKHSASLANVVCTVCVCVFQCDGVCVRVKVWCVCVCL